MPEKFNINDPEALNDMLFPLDYRTDENANEQEHGEIVGDVLGDMPVIIAGLSVTTATTPLKFKVLAGAGRDVDGKRTAVAVDQDDQEPATVVPGAWNYIAIKHAYTTSDARLAKGSGVSYDSRRQDSYEIDISASEQNEADGYIRLTRARNVGGAWEFDDSYRSRDISGASSGGFTTIPTSLTVAEDEAEPLGDFFGMDLLSGKVAKTLAFEEVLVPVDFDPPAVHPEGIRLYEAWFVPEEGEVLQHHKAFPVSVGRAVTVGETNYNRVYVRVPAGAKGRFQGRVIAGNGESSGVIESADVDLFSDTAGAYTIADTDLEYSCDVEGGVRLNVGTDWVANPAFGGATRAYHWFRDDGGVWVEIGVTEEPKMRHQIGPGEAAVAFAVRPRHKLGYFTTTVAEKDIAPNNPNLAKYMESISDGASTTQSGKQVIARPQILAYNINLPLQATTGGNWYKLVKFIMPFDGYIVGHKILITAGEIGIGDVTKLRVKVGDNTKEIQIPVGTYSLASPYDPAEQVIARADLGFIAAGVEVTVEFTTNDAGITNYIGNGWVRATQGDA